MLVGRHERLFTIDGDYIHIMPLENKNLFDTMKTVSLLEIHYIIRRYLRILLDFIPHLFGYIVPPGQKAKPTLQIGSSETKATKPPNL
jgi:hypothetical protein